MKKALLIGLPAVIVLLLVFFGPELVDLYRLQAYLTESEELYQANKGAWPHPVDACEACHGRNGTSLHQGYPSLAGQPEAYLATQLRNFANGDRNNPNMGPLAMTMSEEEIQLYAEFFARQPAKENAYFEADAQGRERGKALAESGGCTGCHGERLMGQGPFPRLASQGYGYLLNQLDAFAEGERNDPTGMMNSLAAGWSPEDRKAIATYLASLPPEQN